jgi:protein-S-isoprenylcysteine O-methyltransferase Ste14
MLQTAEQRSIAGSLPRASATHPMVRWAYRARGTLVAPIVLAAAVIAWRAHPRRVDLALGGALFLVGWAARIWAQRHLGYRLPRRMRLTACGPYRWVRNPVYIGNTLAVTGTTVMVGDCRLAAAAALLCALVYSLAVRHEENVLGQRYGAGYRTYAALTPRWIPSYPSWSPEACCQGSRSWMRVAMAEWQVPLILVPVLVPLVLH